MSDVDLEREKLKLKDLLDMGFIHEDEYRQRFADLTGSTPATATPSLFEMTGSCYTPYLEAPMSTPDLTPSFSSSSSSTYSSPSPAAVGGARPFQPVEPCDCGTTYCRCGLQIPQCLVEDHAQVCTRPEWDTFKCSLQCGSAFGSRVEATAHLKFCSKYIVACRSATDHRCAIFFGTYPSWCGAEVLVCDLPQHWGQEHRNHKDLGELQLPEELECPVGCGQHIGERWGMDHHFNTECEAYTVRCDIVKTRTDSEYHYSYTGVCSEEVRRKDVARHWNEVHQGDPEVGPEMIPMRGVRCPNSECEARMDLDQMSDHLSHCRAYHPVCHRCKNEEMESMDDLKAHVAAGCHPVEYQPWVSAGLLEAILEKQRPIAARHVFNSSHQW
ncbi:uncharacterized protein ACA1_071570 [Acanthamoeba castellanii str. Neff]|uniref:Uncharacterized protein n=1 Tax=Acanthamoeba castellanii (strain ATCC 30010 / Neff) TaxID=1257118 RepID=L8HEC7_ACACF|nr:uncharacterized protein ACA1_071570 [Acanthamoeba castellanii str. Neff]ELR23535.1 hypothetical protein ACA1_071570 [Acanthamoeba castellanii str. Neff]